MFRNEKIIFDFAINQKFQVETSQWTEPSVNMNGNLTADDDDYDDSHKLSHFNIIKVLGTDLIASTHKV